MVRTVEELRSTLEAMQADNDPLHVMDIGDSVAEGAIPHYRSSVLAIEDEAIVIERTRQAILDHALKPGQTIECAAMDERSRWEFRTKVIEHTTFDLNSRVQVPAVRIGMPKLVRNGQRRDFFRVSVAGADLSPVVMQPVEDDGETPCGEPFETEMLNLGGGGLGVQMRGGQAVELVRNARYLCRFELPTHRSPIEVVAELVHLERGPTGKAYLGLRFEFPSEPLREMVSDLICHFSAWHQRRQIQREREREVG